MRRHFSRTTACAATLLLTAPLPLVHAPLFAPYAHAQDYACAVPIHTNPPAPQSTDAQARHAEIDPVARAHRFATGRGVRVAVIDTGITPHPELDQLRPGRDFVDHDNPDPLTDCDSHGTVVAGIIAGTTTGVAPDAELIAIRQTSAHYRDLAEGDGDPTAGSLATLADAIHNAIDEHAHVINISVVSCQPPEIAERIDTDPLDRALGRAEAEGVLVVAAAGNESGECAQGSTVFPAHAPTVLAVGARETPHDIAGYSIRVPGPAVSAPGTVPLALSSDGTGFATGTHGANGPAPYTGTSFAAPTVSGAAALLVQRYPHLRPAELRAHLYAASQPSGGALDPLAAVTQLPPASLADASPLTLTPATEQNSASAGRLGLALLAAALLLVSLVALPLLRARIATFRQRAPHDPASVR